VLYVSATDSPFTVDIIDNRSVIASGGGLTQSEVNQMTTFTVRTGQQNVDNTNSLQVLLRCTPAKISTLLLADVNLRSRSLYAIGRLSVVICRLSVCDVGAPYSAC